MRTLSLVAFFVLQSLVISQVAASDLEALRQKCESYGAQQGTSAFANCMKDLDKEDGSESLNKADIAKCHRVPWTTLYMEGMSYAPSWASGSMASDYGTKYANNFIRKCEEAARQ